MKLFIASDIHGSSLYCEQMRDAFLREGADKLLLLGDILYHGPRNDLPDGHGPKKVIEILNPLADRILCVRGNCDAEVDQMVLDFPIMADYSLLEVNGLTLFATHGHKFSPDHPPKVGGDFVLLCGHTHIPACERCEGFWYMNAGSVSIPKGGSKHGYLILEKRTFTWKTFDGEVTHVQKV